MIISKTPYRISFFGGGTDYPQWYNNHGGEVISTTIDKYLYIFCKYLPNFFEYKYRFCYSKIETVNNLNQINHTAFRKIISYLKIKNGIDVHYNGELPARSGMASSSAFTVGLLNALFKYKNKKINHKDLAKESIYFEQKILKEIVGCQDQIATSIGGFNIINIKKNSKFELESIKNQKFIKKLNKSLFLVYTGINRTAQDIAGSYVNKLTSSKKEYMNKIVSITKHAKKSIKNNNIYDFGGLLGENWEIKKKLSNLVSNEFIDRIYTLGIKNGAIGGKVLGAGGGGFLLFVVPPEENDKFIKKFKKFTIIPFNFENEGSQIIMNNN